MSLCRGTSDGGLSQLKKPLCGFKPKPKKIKWKNKFDAINKIVFHSDEGTGGIGFEGMVCASKC